MSQRIYYFTGTGSSLGIIKKIEEREPKIEAYSIIHPECPMVVEDDVDFIGFIYPIYMNALPYVYQDFIKKLKIKGKPYIYAVATHGGLPGSAGASLLQVLNQTTWSIQAYYELETMNNTPKGVAPKPLMQLDWEKQLTTENYETMLERINVFVVDLIESINERKNNFKTELEPKGKGIIPKFMKLIWRFSKKKPKLNFFVDREACVGCGRCEKVCLTSRISIKNNSPVFLTDDCYYCYACFNYCPTQAIYVKHYEKKEGRYQFPYISWLEIAKQKGTD